MKLVASLIVHAQSGVKLPGDSSWRKFCFKRNNIISTWYSYWHGTLVLHFPELELCLTTSIKHFKDLINAYFMSFLWLVWFGTDGLVSVYYCLVWTAKTQVSFIYKWSLLPTDFYWLFILWLVHLMSNKGLGTMS